MIPARFDYVAPASVEEALQALSQYGDDAKIIAGGQSLLPVLRMRLNAPEWVIDLGKIDSLRGIRDDGDAIVIGAMTTHHEVHARRPGEGARPADHARRRPRSPTRRYATAAPSAGRSRTPTRPATSVRRRWRSGAEFVIAGPGGTRTVDADDFFVDLFETAIGEDEILTEVRIPKHTGWGAHYEKFVRVAHQWPIVAVAATVQGRRRHDHRGARRPDQHGLHPAAGPWRGGGAGRRDGVRGRRTRGGRQGGRRHQPAVGPQRLRRLPQAPRHGAHPAGGRRGGRGRRRQHGPHPPVHRPGPGRRGLGALQRHRARSRSASRAPPSPRSRTTRSRARSRSSSARSRWSTTAPARSSRRTRPRTGWWSTPRARTSAATARPAPAVTMTMTEATAGPPTSR